MSQFARDLDGHAKKLILLDRDSNITIFSDASVAENVKTYLTNVNTNVNGKK